MDTWGNTNQHAAPPRPPPPTRSMSGDDLSRTPSRKPLVSFARSASLAATVSNTTRGLPTPPPLPPLPPDALDREASLAQNLPSMSPFSYSPPYQPASSVPNPDAPLSPPLPPKPPSKYRLFDSSPSSPRGLRSPMQNSFSPPPIIPPRPVTSHGAQSSYSSSSSLPARDRLPPVPARPNAMINSPASDSSDDSWTFVSPTVGNPWFNNNPITVAPPRHGRFGFATSKRPHTAAPSQSLPSHKFGPNDSFPVKSADLPSLPPPPVSMPVPDDSAHIRADDDLKHALALSRAESEHKTWAEQQEDEELAKAIEESLALSMRTIDPNNKRKNVVIQFTEAIDESVESEAVYPRDNNLSFLGGLQISDKSYLELSSPFEKDVPTPSSLFLDMDDNSNFYPQTPEDELATHMQQEETRQMAADILDREEATRRDAEVSKQLHEEETLVELERETQIEKSINKLREAQEQRDAELARMMNEWEQGGPPCSEPAASHSLSSPPPHPQSSPSLPTPPLPHQSPPPPSPQPLPLQSLPRLLTQPLAPQSPPSLPTQPFSFSAAQDGFANEPKPTPSSKPTLERTLWSTPSSPPVGSEPDSSNSNGRSASATSPVSTNYSEVTSVTRSHSGSSTIGSSSHDHNTRNPSLQQPNASWSREPSPGPRTVTASPKSHALPDSQGAEDELADLRGFSYGFSPPNIPVSPPQASLACAPFPDIINLSPTPYPSFHIMAPSWRHLFRLLAGQETRIQPHIDVLANRKEEQKLRVVIQFVKLAYTGNTWRTIIHLSLDEPFPPSVPSSATARFTNGDTTVLPYSYAISDHGRYMMGPNMHIYTVPLSPTSPFPILPITFPNLALYLQSTMKDSRARKVRHDSFRRLAKIVQSCYPEEVMPTAQEEKKPSRGVGNLIKRVVGRGNSDRGNAMGNEDVYDMITPFRLDQYTAATASSSTSISSS